MLTSRFIQLARCGPAPGLADHASASFAWLGYPAGRGKGFPLRRRRGCDWPGINLRHRLAPGVKGTLRDGLFQLELRR